MTHYPRYTLGQLDSQSEALLDEIATSEAAPLSAANMHWYRDHHLQSEEQSLDPLVSPLLANDLSGLPSASRIIAEFDVLRDQGEAYARRLEQAGVAVQRTLYKGVLHDFVILPGLFDRAWDAIDEICRTLREAFAQ